MSQAQQTIASPAASDKAQTAISAAMTKAKNRTTPKAAAPAAKPARATQQDRSIITLESVAALAPTAALAANIARSFGLDLPDNASIREEVEEHMVASAAAVREHLSERALQMFLQRIVGSFVAAAHGSAVFYSAKVTEARDLTSKLANDHRDEDRDGPSGFENKAERARLFAAEKGLEAHALHAAAEGAVYAYAHLVGEDWKPYVAQQTNNQTVSRRSAAEEMAAFGG